MDQHSVSTQNQRKATRYIRKDIKVSFVRPIFFGLKKETVRCELLDISSTGIQISTNKKIALDTIFELTLQFNSGDLFKLNARTIWNKKFSNYRSQHSFSTIKKVLINNPASLEDLTLFENKALIFAQFRHLNETQVQILTYSPLDKNKQHSLVFTLSDKSTHKFVTQIESYKSYKFNCYGMTFEKPNNDLGDCLLETQTHLIFK